MIKKSVLVILSILLLVVAYVGYTNYPKLGIVSGYAAKKMCSCTFIAGRTQESIQKEDLSMSPLSSSSTEIDRENKRVTSSVFGLQPRTAEYRGRLGCILIHGKDDYNVSYPDGLNFSQDVSELSFPYGDKVELLKTKGLDYGKLNSAADVIFDPNDEMTDIKTRALLVLHKDTLIYERYAKGYDADTEMLGWSMTKSILNTWVGMLIKEGKISIEQKNLFPEWANDERKNITLNNLLQMSSGLEWEEVYKEISPATKMLYESENNGKTAMQQPYNVAPNVEWEYSSGTSNIISLLLRNHHGSHDEYLKFPYDSIFSRINMNNTTIETDESGTYIGSSYTYATARDWARFGTLYLRDGVWNGDRLLPEGWVDYSRTPAPASGGEYGAHFWMYVNHEEYPGAPQDMFSANGHEGQRISIIPSKDLVIVRLGLSKNLNFNKLVNDICASVK